MKSEKIYLVGKSGSGKDHLMRYLRDEKNLKHSLKITTRPSRKNERNGIDYNFISKEDFQTLIKENKLDSYEVYNEWYYGVELNDFENNQVFIKTPSEVAKLTEDQRKRTFVVYIDVDEETRRKRLSRRNDADSVERRIKSDEMDFKDFKDYDLRISDPEFDPEMIYDLML